MKSSRLTILSETDLVVGSSGPLKSKTWFRSDPLTVQDIDKIWGFQLSTFSTNQGWVGDPNAGCWSWFEVAIYTPKSDDTVINLGQRLTRPDLTVGDDTYILKTSTHGKECTWVSHRNSLYQRAFHSYDGDIFGCGHEIWSYLSPGDCIVVLACCQFGAWSCKGKGAALTFWEYYDPRNAHDF